MAKRRRRDAAGLTRLAFMPDTHFPYHDPKAFQVFLNAMDVFRPDWLFILGDAFDFYSVSFHLRDPRRESRLVDEIGKANRELDRLQKVGAEHTVFVEGNHEDRLRRYMWQKAPELEGLATVKAVLRLEHRKWEYVPYKDHYRLGKLYVTHDVDRCGKHAVRQSLEDYQANVVIGHVHQIGYFVNRTVRGKAHVAMCPGWLGDFGKIDYRHRARMRDWSHGFGIGYMEPNGHVHLRPVPIVGGSCVVEGKLVK